MRKISNLSMEYYYNERKIKEKCTNTIKIECEILLKHARLTMRLEWFIVSFINGFQEWDLLVIKFKEKGKTMALSQEQYKNYLSILQHELIPALGCTEPIAIAYVAAKAREVLGEFPDRVVLRCSGNIIKNVKGVTVPNSLGMKGIDAAAVLGVVGGDASKQLQVLASVREEDIQATKQLLGEAYCDCMLAEDVPNLYIEVEAFFGKSYSKVVIAEQHTNIILIEKDGEILLDKRKGEDEHGNLVSTLDYDKSKLTVKEIVEFADELNPEDVREIFDRQIEMNVAISQSGFDKAWGAQVGKTMMATWGNDVKTRATARAAAGSDARMSGCSLPVVINSGSGNQGITVSMPVYEYAKELQLSKEALYRALAVSNLVSIHIKYYIGSLSAFCGAVSAACGAGAAITYMHGGNYEHIGRTITATLANVGGIVCDGAKPSCAAKIASSVNASILAHHMSMSDNVFSAGEGFVEEELEETIKNMGYIGRVGMKATDVEILNVMIDKADTNYAGENKCK